MVAQSSQPTIKEDVSSVRSPQATVRAQSSYVHKRPDHVTMNNAGTNSWAYLAKSLGQFDASFSKYAERKTQENIDEAVAKGQLLFEENTTEGRNQQDWKSLIEARPEYAGSNPHLKKGYEQARLRALGLDASKAYNDAFTASGLQNEENQEVIDKWTQDFWLKYRQENKLTEYDNPVLLAREFSPFEAKAKQSLMQRHSESLRVQQESKTKMAFANLAVTEVNQLLDPTRGGLDIEDELGEGHQIVMGAIQKNVTEALAKGVLNVHGPDMAWDIIENLYLTSDNEDFLEIAKTMEIGGIKLYSLPNVVKSVERYEAQLVEKERAETAAYQQNLERQKKQAKENGIVAVLKWEEENPDKILTKEVLYEMGIPLIHHTDMMKVYNATRAEEDKALKGSTAYKTGYADAYIASSNGNLTREQAVELYKLTGDEVFLTNLQKHEDKYRKQEMQVWTHNNLSTPPTAEILKELGYGEEHLPEFMDIYNKTVKAHQASREDPYYVSYAEKIAKNVGGYFGKTQGEDMTGMGRLVISPERQIEAQRYARGVFQEAYTKLKADMGGIPSEAQVADLMYKVEGEVVSFLTKHYGSQSGETQSNPASDFINGGNTPKPQGQKTEQGETQKLSPEASALLEEYLESEVLTFIMNNHMNTEEVLTFLEKDGTYPEVLRGIREINKRTPSPKNSTSTNIHNARTPEEAIFSQMGATLPDALANAQGKQQAPEEGHRKMVEGWTDLFQDYLKEDSPKKKGSVQKKTLSKLPAEAQEFLTSNMDESMSYYLKRANPSVEDIRQVLGKNSPELLPRFDMLSQDGVNVLPFLEKVYGKGLGATMLYHLSYDDIRQKLQKEHPELLTKFMKLIGE